MIKIMKNPEDKKIVSRIRKMLVYKVNYNRGASNFEIFEEGDNELIGKIEKGKVWIIYGTSCPNEDYFPGQLYQIQAAADLRGQLEVAEPPIPYEEETYVHESISERLSILIGNETRGVSREEVASWVKEKGREYLEGLAKLVEGK